MGKNITHESDPSKNETPDLNSLKPFPEASENVFHSFYPMVCLLWGMYLCTFLSCR